MNYATLDDIMSEAVAWMSEKYADLGTCDNFPSFREALKCLPSASGLPDVEIARICEAFAEHECGSIPTGFSDVLHKLARRYRIALVSDICAVKPSPLPVLHAMRAMGAGREHCFLHHHVRPAGN